MPRFKLAGKFCNKAAAKFFNKVFQCFVIKNLYHFVIKFFIVFAIKLDINSIQPGGIAIVWGKKVAHKGG